MSDIPAAHRAHTAAQLGCHGGTRHEPPLVVHATGASDTPVLENQFYGCCVPQLYNEQRPHSSLGYRTPNEFAREHKLKDFYVAGVGQEDSNAVPLPHTPKPAESEGGVNINARIQKCAE